MRTPRPGPGLPRWSVWVLLGVLAAVLLLSPLLSTDNSPDLKYREFLEQVIDLGRAGLDHAMLAAGATGVG